MARSGLAGLAALIAAAGALWLVDRETEPAEQVESLVKLSESRSPTVPPLAAATPWSEPGAALPSHREPPPPGALANNAARQAAYDAEAKPGDFVTPPIVSIEH